MESRRRQRTRFRANRRFFVFSSLETGFVPFILPDEGIRVNDPILKGTRLFHHGFLVIDANSAGRLRRNGVEPS